MAKSDNNERKSKAPCKRKAIVLWTTEEDDQLKRLMKARAGTRISWAEIARMMDGDRSAKQCRERWLNQLRPDLKKGGWTSEEDQLIHSLQRKMGNSWSAIAKYLPNRTDNDIKNRWHSFKRSQSRRSSNDSTKTNWSARDDKPTKKVRRDKILTPPNLSLPKLTPGFTPIRHDETESILLENAALSLSAMKSREAKFYDTNACGKENRPAAGQTAPANKTVCTKIKRAVPCAAVDIFSPTYFTRHCNPKNNITPCSSRALASLPPCNSGPFINTPLGMDRYDTPNYLRGSQVVMRREQNATKTNQTSWAASTQNFESPESLDSFYSSPLTPPAKHNGNTTDWACEQKIKQEQDFHPESSTFPPNMAYPDVAHSTAVKLESPRINSPWKHPNTPAQRAYEV